MIGLVLVTHGCLAHEFRAALEHVVGPQTHLETVAIGPEDDMDDCRQEILSAVCKADAGDGVVVLTDMFGGTPSNLAVSCMKSSKVEVIAGINLPLLIKLASVREDHLLDEAVVEAQEAGRKYISIASHVLTGR